MKTKYEELVDELVAMIESGAYRPHERFFSVEKLQERYQIGRNTVIKILQRLEADGRIYRKSKSGTYVSPPQKFRQILLVTRTNRERSGELNSFIYHTEQDTGLTQNFKISVISEEDFLRDFDYLEIVHRNVAGVIFFRLQDTFAAFREKLQAKKIIPVFYGSSMFRPQLGSRNCYYYEEKEVVYAVLDRLYQAGHRKIGCAYYDSGVFLYRKQLYVEWMIKHGLFVDQRALLECRAEDVGGIHHQLMARNPADLGFTALFSTYYGFSIEAVLAFSKLGVKIPEEVALIGIGTTTALNFFIPRLTSLVIDHKGDAVKIIRQIAAASGDPYANVTGSSKISFLEGQSV